MESSSIKIHPVNLGEAMKGLSCGIKEYKNYPQRRYDYFSSHNYSPPRYGRDSNFMSYSPSSQAYKRSDIYSSRK